MYIWQLNSVAGNELKSHHCVDRGYFKVPESLKDPQMSTEEETTSHTQHQETDSKTPTSCPAALSLLVSWNVMKRLRLAQSNRYLSDILSNSTGFCAKYWKVERETEKCFVLYCPTAGMGGEEGHSLISYKTTNCVNTVVAKNHLITEATKPAICMVWKSSNGVLYMMEWWSTLCHFFTLNIFHFRPRQGEQNKTTHFLLVLLYLFSLALSGIFLSTSRVARLDYMRIHRAKEKGSILNLQHIRHFLHHISQLTRHQMRQLCNPAITLLFLAT